MKFYVLQNPKVEHGDAVTDYLYADGSRMGDAPRCPKCGQYVGMLPLLPPVCVELEAWGVRWGDVAFGTGEQILVSDQLRRLFLEFNLIGVTRFDPVRVVNVKGRLSEPGPPPSYHLASIQRSRAAIDDLASEIARDGSWTCDECRVGGIIKRVGKVAVEANTWSGEDVFVARGLPGTILASERFKYLCEGHDLKNCFFVPALDSGRYGSP